MPISPKWKSEESYEYSWSVAQIKAPLADVIASINRTHCLRDLNQPWNGQHFELGDDCREPLIAYSLPSTDWVFVECLRNAIIDVAALVHMSHDLQTDVLVTDYCYDVGGQLLSHCKNGTVEEEYTTSNFPEEFTFESIDEIQREWKTDEAKTIFRYGNCETELKIESANFQDWWNELADHLGLEIPFLCWTNWSSDSTVTFNANEVTQVSGAHLLGN